MYGNISSYEGCKFLDDSFAKHSKFKAWFLRMKEKLETGYIEPIEITKNIDGENISIRDLADDSDNNSTIKQTEPINLVNHVEIIQPQTQASTVDTASANGATNNKATNITTTTTTTTNVVAIAETASNKPGAELEDNLTLKILPTIYIIHVLAFTFAAYMSKYE